MLGRTYTKIGHPRETTFDLYTEAERLPWFFKALSTFSAWLVLAGYVLFSIAYSSTQDELRISSSLMTGLAATGILLGYLSDAALAFLSRSLIFTFDGVLMPVLTASAVGLFSTVVHRAVKKTTEPGNSIYLFLPLAVAAVATVIAGVLSFIVYRKLRRIKELDARRRSHIPLDGMSPMLPHGVSREVRDMVPDDEQQRRQLMRLLMAQADRASSIDEQGSTYRIDLPGEEGMSRQRSSSIPPAPKATNSRFTISNLVSGRDRSTSETFRDPREMRREQIERGALMPGSGRNSAQDGPIGGSTLNPAWHGQRQSPPLRDSPRYG